ncbi:MAG: 5,6-dimethylbenzimidazole synthase [Thaumarchaeota archaeon]|nr:MAG: 5,6-dimethylbenzimidazole synthase [Nitrososphaerota archaeon]TLX91189.1 MAG: 5,6-dimethylbenzimidazole synthase [Nitrososphaerota archaeon]
MSTNVDSFTISQKEGLYKAVFSRRDIRSHFNDKKIPGDVLVRILNAAHHAPSVGFSQPWDFILIKKRDTRLRVKNSFNHEREKSISLLDNDLDRQDKYVNLKLEGILESDINICVTYNPERFGPFILGRTSIPETGEYSVCCAIQNLWLAARAEGIGVGWVSILSIEDLRKILGIPNHVKPIAYLCLGYVNKFEDRPDLERLDWLRRTILSKVIHFENWNNTELNNWNNTNKIIQNLNGM